MSEEWSEHQIGDFCDVSAGGTPDTSVKEYWEHGTIPWMSSGEVHKQRIRETESFITPLGLQNSSAKFFPKDSVLVALAGQGKTRGKVAISKIELTTNQSIAAIIAKQEICDPEFLYHNLSSRYEELRSLSGGSGRAGLNLSILSGIEISLPPLPEQKKIAEILSGIDRLISMLGKREHSLRNLLEGAIGEIFSIALGVGEERRLCDIVNPDRPITYGIVQTGEKLLEGIPCVRVADFDSGTLDPSTMIKTSHEISSQYERTILQRGDLMVALRGDIGRTEIASGVLAGANLTRGVALLSKSYGVNPQYLRYAMRSPSVRRQIKDGTNGSALQEIPLKNLREILIPLPSVPQQVAHAVFLESIEVLLTSTLSQRRSLELSKCALSSDLLSGRNRVSI
jgi:type I restriction enzyme S subunit